MKLILFRHGLALDRDLALAQNISDELRPIVKKGADRTKKMGHYINEQWPDKYLVVYSPLLRSRQTSQALVKEVNCIEQKECSEIVPSAPVDSICHWLSRQHIQDQSVILIGHEPHLSLLGSWLIAGSTQSFFGLKKSGFALLEVEDFESLGPRRAELKALIQPKLLFF